MQQLPRQVEQTEVIEALQPKGVLQTNSQYSYFVQKRTKKTLVYIYNIYGEGIWQLTDDIIRQNCRTQMGLYENIYFDKEDATSIRLRSHGYSYIPHARAHSLIKLILQKDSSRVTCHIMWENTNQHMIYCYTFKCLYQEPRISLNKLNQAVDILLIDISFISSLQHLK